MGQSDGGIYLVESIADVATLEVRDPVNLAYVTQTTLSVDDAASIVDALKITPSNASCFLSTSLSQSRTPASS